jgi:hypothetical protein
MEALLIAQIAISVVGIGGLVYWMRKWFKALEGAVNAQKNTIEAQKAHIEGMANFLNIADAPRMAERYEAYKKILDAEKDAWMKANERKIQGEQMLVVESTTKLEDAEREAVRKQQMQEEIERAKEAAINLRHDLYVTLRQRQSLYFSALSTLAANFKSHPLDWEIQKGSLPTKLQEEIEGFMKRLPPPQQVLGVLNATLGPLKADIKGEVTRAGEK